MHEAGDGNRNSNQILISTQCVNSSGAFDAYAFGQKSHHLPLSM